MDDEQVSRIREAMSAERLAPYEADCAGDGAAALRLYSWNLEVSAAVWGPLNCLEVVCRNAMHRELSTLFGRPDWWFATGVGLHLPAERMVEEARQELARQGKVATPGRIVAELRFGFWVSLLGKGNGYEMRLWRPGLCQAFPGHRGPCRPLHRDLNSVRLFRNRIAHHEPIFRRHLAADHATVMRLIAAVSPETAEFARQRDRVPAVLARRAEVCDGRVAASF
jgi:hypothetical protein